MEIDLLITDCFLDLAELLETVAQGFIVCMPRKAADAIALVFPFGCDCPASQRSSERYEETNILDKEFGHDECRMSGRDCESIRTEKEKMNGHDARGKKRRSVHDKRQGDPSGCETSQPSNAWNHHTALGLPHPWEFQAQ